MTGGAVDIIEVGPRDGLQNESEVLSVSSKIGLIDRLSLCGLKHIEVTSFVSPRWVPQMADAGRVLAGIRRVGGVCYSVLTPNERGFDAAIESGGVDEVAVFASASEAFSLRNINCSVDESINRFKPIMAKAEVHGIAVRGYISCVIACPYSGLISADAVLRLAERLLALGCYEVSLGDTIGAGCPQSVGSVLDVLVRHVSPEQLAGHFHDTGGCALANVEAALAYGVRRFDSSVGGLGGCPYAGGAAKGNVSTRALVGFLEGLGYETGVDLERLAEAEAFLQSLGFLLRHA